MQERDIIHGFAVTRVRELPEMGGKLWEMEHQKTGAQLCWLDRPDENKTFSIAFKTLPEDSTGVFHILEHSVLCGSDKYPVKEPFVELLKSSVQTFLNAMTYSDKTVYPVSSRNDKDLLNLIDVYLDAVLHPAIYHKPEIFRQEGWRIEGEGEDLCYQGVVFNEMKGAFASPNRVLEQEMESLLFPDNCYHFCSGGDPACIPELTYERFLAFHQKYYHPSNARISLVGSVQLDSVLEKIDRFLSPYERQEANFPIPMQKPVPAVEKTLSYEIGEDEPTEQRTMISCGTLLGSYDEDLKSFAANVLADYLTGDDDAPLKRAVLDRKLGQELSVNVNDGTQQVWVSWEVMNTDADQLPALRRTIRETLEQVAAEGMDAERLDACFHRYAFQLRDRDSDYAPRSLSEALQMLDTWLYGGDPAEGLVVEDTLRQLEQLLHTGYFENLIRELFLDNAHTVTVVLTPSSTLGEEKRRNEQAHLDRAVADWTEADWTAQRERAEALRLWQQTPDSEEALATIPMLRLSDLNSQPSLPVAAEERRGGVPVLRHNLGSGLVYVHTHFLATDLPLEDLPSMTVLCRLLGSMTTARLDRSHLPLEIKNTMGRLDFHPLIQAGSSPELAKIRLTASMACLNEQAEAAMSLLGEILTQTRWDDLSLLRDALQQMSMGAQLSMPSRGHQIGLSRVSGDLTAHGAAREFTGGLEYTKRIKALSEAGEEAHTELLSKLNAMARRLFTKNRLTLSVSDNIDPAAVDCLLRMLPAGDAAPEEVRCTLPGPRQEGVVIPAAVGFAVMGTNLRLHGRSFHGSIPVLSAVLSYVYLWSKIRVEGGAYGCGFGGRNDGDLFFYTYRDPQPARSLDVIRQSAVYVRAYCAENPDLTGFILGSVSNLDPLMNAESRMTVAENRLFAGVTEADVCRWYQELLHTDVDDLLRLCDGLDELFADNAVCVVAGKDQLEACGDRIQEILTV